MKSIFKLFLISIIFSLLSTPCYSGTSHGPIANLLKISGVTKQVKDIPGLFEEAITIGRQQGVQISDENFAAILGAIYSSVDPDFIMETITNELGTSLSDNEVQHLIAWYSSETGKMIVTKEQSASDPGVYQQILEGQEVLLKDTARVEFAKRMGALMGATDMTMRIQEYSSIATYSAFMSILSPRTPVDIANFKATTVAPQMEQLRAHLEQLIIAILVYSYKDVDLKSLQQYEAFLTDPRTRTFNHKVVEGMAKGLEGSIEKFAGSIAIIASESL